MLCCIWVCGMGNILSFQKPLFVFYEKKFHLSDHMNQLLNVRYLSLIFLNMINLIFLFTFINWTFDISLAVLNENFHKMLLEFLTKLFMYIIFFLYFISLEKNRILYLPDFICLSLKNRKFQVFYFVSKQQLEFLVFI